MKVEVSAEDYKQASTCPISQRCIRIYTRSRVTSLRYYLALTYSGKTVFTTYGESNRRHPYKALERIPPGNWCAYKLPLIKLCGCSKSYLVRMHRISAEMDGHQPEVLVKNKFISPLPPRTFRLSAIGVIAVGIEGARQREYARCVGLTTMGATL